MHRRLFFVPAVSLALLGSSLGSAWAWQFSDQAGPGTASVGSNAAQVFVDPIAGALIGPNGGPPVTVGEVVVRNLGTFALQIDSAAVTITSVTPLLPGGASCLPSYFTGSHGPLPAGPFGPPPPVAFSESFFVRIAANFSPTHDDCQGDDVHYSVTVNVSNP